MRGPLVYCLEETDNGPHLNSLVLPEKSSFVCEEVNELGGTVRIEADARRESQGSDELYTQTPPQLTSTRISAIPYYAWDNRDPGEMLVWLRREGV